jgi:hypothetical protein
MKHDNNNGHIGDGLHELTKQLHEEIGAAVRKSDTSAILSLTEKLRRVDALRQRHEAIRSEMRALTQENSSSPLSVHVEAQRARLAHGDSSAQKESRKALASRERNSWLAEHGSTLTHIRGTIYQNSKGERVGITYSTGRKTADGRKWWLGLPEGEFQSAVLLCAQNDGGVKAVCLPRSFIDAHRNLLSRSSGGQDQFNIFDRGGKCYLVRQDIDRYVDNCSMVL